MRRLRWLAPLLVLFTSGLVVGRASAQEWLRAAPMRQPRGDHAAAALRDGRVLVACGENGSFIYKSAELYDPATDTWTAAAPMPRVRTQFLMTRLLDGRVLALRGL